MNKRKYVYVTKSVNKDMTSHHTTSFKYPEKGFIEAPDWNETAECGNGLHGFLWGEGNPTLASYIDCKWLLIKVAIADGFIALDGKCKFRKGEVIKAGTMQEVTEELKKYLPKDRYYNVIGATVTAGDYGTATAGARGTVTAGDYGTATAGAQSTATVGDWGTATTGALGTAKAGYKGTAIAGVYGTAIVGARGTAIAGDNGTATVGYKGTATAGYNGISTTGDYGTATVGTNGKAKAGIGGILILKTAEAELKSFEVDGITVKADTFYSLNENRELEENENE